MTYMYNARYSSLAMSTIEPGLLDTAAAAKRALQVTRISYHSHEYGSRGNAGMAHKTHMKKRTTKISAKLVARPVGMMRTVATAWQTM
jgi:hypothetical protein